MLMKRISVSPDGQILVQNPSDQQALVEASMLVQLFPIFNVNKATFAKFTTLKQEIVAIRKAFNEEGAKVGVHFTDTQSLSGWLQNWEQWAFQNPAKVSTHETTIRSMTSKAVEYATREQKFAQLWVAFKDHLAPSVQSLTKEMSLDDVIGLLIQNRDYYLGTDGTSAREEQVSALYDSHRKMEETAASLKTFQMGYTRGLVGLVLDEASIREAKPPVVDSGEPVLEAFDVDAEIAGTTEAIDMDSVERGFSHWQKEHQQMVGFVAGSYQQVADLRDEIDGLWQKLNTEKKAYIVRKVDLGETPEKVAKRLFSALADGRGPQALFAAYELDGMGADPLPLMASVLKETREVLTKRAEKIKHYKKSKALRSQERWDDTVAGVIVGGILVVGAGLAWVFLGGKGGGSSSS